MHLLIEKNLGYARSCADKYTLRAPRSSAQWEDAFSAASIALVEAAASFRPGAQSLGAYAWPRMKFAIQKLREGEKNRWKMEVADDECDGPCEGDPESLYIEAERGEVVLDRMARLTAAQRKGVEALLDGRRPEGRFFNPETLARRAGVAASAPKSAALSGSARSARWFANMTPEQKKARNEKRRARKNAAKQGVAA